MIPRYCLLDSRNDSSCFDDSCSSPNVIGLPATSSHRRSQRRPSSRPGHWLGTTTRMRSPELARAQRVGKGPSKAGAGPFHASIEPSSVPQPAADRQPEAPPRPSCRRMASTSRWRPAISSARLCALESVTDRLEVGLRRPVVVAPSSRVLTLGSSQLSGQALPVESLRKQGHDVLRGFAGAWRPPPRSSCPRGTGPSACRTRCAPFESAGTALKVKGQHVVGKDPAELFPAFVERGTKWLQGLRGALHAPIGRRVDPLRLGPCHCPAVMRVPLAGQREQVEMPLRRKTEVSRDRSASVCTDAIRRCSSSRNRAIVRSSAREDPGSSNLERQGLRAGPVLR